jgi:HEAT repeats
MQSTARFLALTCFLLTSAATASDDSGRNPKVALPQATSASSSSTDADSKEMKRMLHLSNGQIIRVVSRWSGDHWEYKNKSGWRALAPGQVNQAVLESEVLKTWNAERDHADLKKVEDRVKLARSALASGLTQEGMAQIDVVLAREPDQADALALLDRKGLMNVPSLDGPPDGLAERKDTLYRWAASVPISGRELAVRELGGLDHDDALRDELTKELGSMIVTRRTFAALALRRIYPGGAVKPLLRHAVLDPSEEVRDLSALALRAVNEPAVIVPVVRALSSDSSSVRANAAEALGVMGYSAAVQPLIERLAIASAAADSSGRTPPHGYIFVGSQMAYVQDFDVQVAQYAAIAKPIVNTLISGDVLDAGVIGVQDVVYEVEVATIGKSLQKLTGVPRGKTAKEWLKWWDENGSKWQSADLSRKTPATGPGAKE